MKQSRRYVNTSKKIVKQYQHTTFNKRCCKHGVVPRSLEVKPLVNTDEGRRIASRASSRFLSARISKCYRTLKKLKQDLLLQGNGLSKLIDDTTMESIEVQCKIASKDEKEKVKERQKKFDTLAGTRGRKKPGGMGGKTPRKE